MKIDTILNIIFIAGFVIGLVSLFIWALSKNKKVSKFFKKIADWIGETWSHSGW